MLNKSIASFLLLTAALASCKTTGVDSAAQTSGALRATYQALEAAPEKIDAVVAAFQGLQGDNVDMVKQFETLGTEVGELQSHAKRIKSLRTSLKSDEADFAKQWEERLAKIESEDLRDLAKQRREELVDEFEKISATADEGKAAFEPWMQTVTDLASYLEFNLNPEGIAAVSDKITEIADGAAPIKTSIQEVLDQMSALADRIEATKPQPPEPKTDGDDDDAGEDEGGDGDGDGDDSDG